MTTIVSHRTNRREVSLAMPSPTVVEDDATSRHLNTLQIANEKAKTSELPDLAMTAMIINGGVNEPGDDTTIPGLQACGGDKTRQEQDVSGAEAAESGEMHEMIVDTISRNEPPSYIPSHLHESSKPNPRQNSHQPPPSPSTRVQSETLIVQDQGDEEHPRQAGGTVRNGQDSGQTTPTGSGYIHRRIQSSSIPHLLSTSNSFSVDAQHLIQTPLNQSMAFSVDGDDSAYQAVPTPPLAVSTAYPPAHLVMNLKQGIASPLEGCSPMKSSSTSLTSCVSPSRNISASPPQKVPCVQIGLDMPTLSQPPASTISPDNASSDQQNQANNAEVGKLMLTTKQYSGAGLPLPSHPLPPSYQDNRYQMPSAVQPVLYSAINSLERYNAGSFENKLMIAKARGTYVRTKAFPGVPKKKTDQLPSGNISREGLGTAVDSGLESKSSSILSALAGRNGSSIDREDRIQQTGTSRDSALIEQVGVEQLVSITSKPSESRIYKSKSSGNLGEKDKEGTPESLSELKARRRNKSNRSVTINDQKSPSSKGRRREKKVGVFRPSSDAYTPRMGKSVKYKPAEERASVEKISSTMGTIQRPNFRDALRRVSIILHQHIVKIESRFSTGIRGVDDTGLFKASMREHFQEDNFATPRYKCSMVRVPMARPGVVYSMRKIRVHYTIPTTDEIYEFAHQLFKKVQLSSECSIVCLIYVEKLMEVAKVPLVAETWRPIFMCGLLLASKVWQDLSSWNIEFASVYPQFSLNAINRLEISFLKFIKWDLYISSSLYAKYYFALRSLLEKSGFRDRYNQMVGGIGGIAASEALKVSKRSEAVKEEALQQLSRSM